MTLPVALVVAKAPVPGEAKTRLGRVVGAEHAAELAAAAWLDTLEACATAFGTDRCHLALTGDLSRAARASELAAAISPWTVHMQRGDGFADRLWNAHHDVFTKTGAPVVQIGMDTPQVEARHLHEAESLLADGDDAVLGPADDGGWWLVGVGGPHLLEHLTGVPMSTADTGRLTRAALEKAGARVQHTGSLRDIDEVADAEAVASLAPGTRFALAWRDRRDARC